MALEFRGDALGMTTIGYSSRSVSRNADMECRFKLLLAFATTLIPRYRRVMIGIGGLPPITGGISRATISHRRLKEASGYHPVASP
ncbi:hypothetical protein HAX54_015253, partial [Datura stramonium]|nr:hypothetical protein [Datura stramonium]